MIPSHDNSWLVPLADLSLILFVATAVSLSASLKHDDDQGGASYRQSVATSVLVDSPDGPSLTNWLARYQQDPGGQLTIMGSYTGADRDGVTQRAGELAKMAISAGVEPRLVIEPGRQSQVMTLFAYDRDPQVAQSLLIQGQD